MSMDVSYTDRYGMNTSILNATSTNLTAFTMRIATLLEEEERKLDNEAYDAQKLAKEHNSGDPDQGYSRWLEDQAVEAARLATEADDACRSWGTFWHEEPTVTASSMILALNSVYEYEIDEKHSYYVFRLIAECTKILRDQGDLTLRIV